MKDSNSISSLEIKIVDDYQIALLASPMPPLDGLAIPGLGTRLIRLISGSVVIMVLGGLALFNASCRDGGTHTAEHDVDNEVMSNPYFQQLIASGVTTDGNLKECAHIRPYGNDFIGVSLAPLTWDQANELAHRTGSLVLSADQKSIKKNGDLAEWVLQAFPQEAVKPLWLAKGGKPAALASSELLAINPADGARQVLLYWQAEQPPGGVSTWADSAIPAPDADGWITLFDGEKIYGCSPDEISKAGDKISIEDGALVLDNTWVTFNISAYDIDIRVMTKKGSCDMLGIGCRQGANNRKCKAYFHGRGSQLGDFGLWLNGATSRADKAKDSVDHEDFFQMELIATNSSIYLKANDNLLTRAEDNLINQPGQISVYTRNGRGLFRKIQVKILDQPASQALEGDHQKGAN